VPRASSIAGQKQSEDKLDELSYFVLREKTLDAAGNLFAVGVEREVAGSAWGPCRRNENRRTERKSAPSM
jgi:hypothetical protein